MYRSENNARPRRVAIIHALPLEYYPPVTNLLGYLSSLGGLDVEVFTVPNGAGRSAYVHNGIRIHRFPWVQVGDGMAARLWKHTGFTFRTVQQLCRFRPAAILYFEPHSAMPAYVYARYFNQTVAILLHNHEYYDPDQFRQPGMRILRLCHQREVSYLYRRAVWISQTNADRLELLLRDYPFIDRSVTRVLPNYPPRFWVASVASQPKPPRPPLRCVHIGSVSLEDSYVREICAWVVSQKGAVTLDLYDYKIPARTRQFLAGVEGDLIRCFDIGVPYAELPRLLPQYHVGLILHRGTTANYVYNAPNKLFEYLACGLDVWCPLEMLGVGPYLRHDAAPKVFSADFNRLDAFDAMSAVSDGDTRVCSSTYTCEEALSALVEKLRTA